MDKSSNEKVFFDTDDEDCLSKPQEFKKQKIIMFFSTKPLSPLAYAFDDEECPTKKEVKKLESEGYSHYFKASRQEIVNSKVTVRSIRDVINDRKIVVIEGVKL